MIACNNPVVRKPLRNWVVGDLSLYPGDVVYLSLVLSFPEI